MFFSKVVFCLFEFFNISEKFVMVQNVYGIVESLLYYGIISNDSSVIQDVVVN